MKQVVTSIQALNLLDRQRKNWVVAENNYSTLSQVKVKELSFGGFTITVQFNPARIVSSAAKVDTKSIQERKCFLCGANRPAEQEGLYFGDEYTILVNPFPIFPEHLTIPVNVHKDQRISHHYGDMLDLAQALDKFTIFYNGPKCGASAPDHMHFQAGNRGFLPIETEWKNVSWKVIYRQTGLNLYVLNDYLRSTFVLESERRDEAVRVFEMIYSMLPIKDEEEEPMMNLLTWYEAGRWVTCLFPRGKHRPDCYYAEGDDNLLISPASVDFGGVFITPLEKDFNKISEKDIRTVFKEVSLSREEKEKLVERIKGIL